MKNASRFIRFLSFGLTSLLLMASVWSRQVVVPVASEGKAETEQKAKSPVKPASHQHTVLSELSPMAVAAPVVVQFSQDFVPLLSPVVFTFSAVKNLLPAAPIRSIRLAYFEVLFRHFIVVNAP
ncbi:MAG: hypothetical protein LH606_21495 [Cytophagaceae bacterium]|nr:hypothetical protein [Cytophagaceae bacterium]